MDLRAVSLILSFLGAACTTPEGPFTQSCSSLWAGRPVTRTDPNLEADFCDINAQLSRLENVDDKVEWVISLFKLTDQYSFLDFAGVERFLRKQNSRAYLFALPLSQAPAGSFAVSNDGRRLNHFIYIDFGDEEQMRVIRKTFHVGTTEENLKNLQRTGLLVAP